MLSSFYPVVAGRTSDSLSRNRSLYQVQISKIATQQLETQLSTGRRISVPSDDPTAAVRIIGLQRDLEFRDQAIRNLDSSQSYLNVTETALSNTQDVLTQIRGLGVESAGTVTSEAERSGWISQINASISRLTAAANTKHLDRYLFAGGVVDRPTVDSRNGLIQFQGNDSSLLTIANDGEYIAHNVTGQRAFGLISDGIISNVNLNPAAFASTRLADLNSGRGVSPGAIQISDGIEGTTIDLASSETVGDVLQRINNAVPLSGRQIRATLTNGALSINFTDGNPGTLRIAELGTGTTGADLGFASSSLGGSVPRQGAELFPILRPTTDLTQLNGGTGFNAQDGFQLEQNGRKYTILIGTARTIEDITNTINSSGANVLADITPDGKSLRVRSTESGSDFSIGESTGNLAERLGLRTFTGTTRLSQLNHGDGVTLADGPDLVLVRNDGSEFSLDFNGRVTVQNALDLINNSGDNQDPARKITATLNAAGNGITLTSDAYVLPSGAPPLTTTPGPIKVRNAGGSQLATELGLVPRGQSDAIATSNASNYSLIGSDPNPQEVNGVFNSLIRLRDAIQNQDPSAIGRAVGLIDQDLSRLSLTRSSLGVEQQRIDEVKNLQEVAQIELKADESQNLDADLTQTITELNARQIAYEASLKILAQSSQLSIFNYL
jgi:flagellar hook-associated protein 3 FlgL